MRKEKTVVKNLIKHLTEEEREYLKELEKTSKENIINSLYHKILAERNRSKKIADFSKNLIKNIQEELAGE